MKEPVLVIMAAGMGSRYGGLKQIDPVDEQGHLMIDFSIHDALEAGFKNIVFVIKPEMEHDMKELIGDRISKKAQVTYVHQRLENIPNGYVIPEGRVKPWGTGHAILSCIQSVEAPFAVINADDYYGKNGFCSIYNFLLEPQKEDMYSCAMVGYQLHNTLTEYGHVARGVCEVTKEGYLCGIQERTRIESFHGEARYTTDDGKTWETLSSDSIVSMNMWGFDARVLNELEKRFTTFLEEEVPGNPLKAEFFLPTVVSELLKEKKAVVKVLPSVDKWYGVTYKEDKEVVVNAIAALKAKGLYPGLGGEG